VFYAAKDGTVTFLGRDQRYAQTTSAYTFGDGPGELHFADDVVYDFDPTYVVNDVTVTETGGVTANATDAASISSYFRRRYNSTIPIQSDSEITDAAGWILNLYKDPHLRVEKLTLNPAADTSLWPVCLNIEIGTRVTVNRRPPFGSVISQDYFVEQIEHDVDFGAGKWTTTLTASPVTYGNAWVLNDTTQSVLGTTTRLVY
jgi:hypothetical protein